MNKLKDLGRKNDFKSPKKLEDDSGKNVLLRKKLNKSLSESI